MVDFADLCLCDLVAAANKTYLAGEYGWTESKGSTGDSLSPWFNVLEQSPGAIGSKFWSLFGHDVPNCNVSRTF